MSIYEKGNNKGSMAQRLCVFGVGLAMVFMASAVQAGGRQPCDRGAGGVSHCMGGKFVCKNGKISGSKYVCESSRYPAKSRKGK